MIAISQENTRARPPGYPEAVEPYRRPDGRPRIARREQLLFESDLVAVGVFDARPDDPHFRCSGPPGEPLFVFPSTSVRIEHDGGPSFVADRNLVTFYEPDQMYTRTAVSHRGDRGHWFSLQPDVFDELRACGRTGRPRSGVASRPMAPVDARQYAGQTALVRRLVDEDPISRLEIEERVLGLARAAFGARAGGCPNLDVSAAHHELAERARVVLARRYPVAEPLSRIAARVGASPFHLARVFRAATGTSLHRHREQLRLRRACLELPERLGDLTGLALDLGYSSHSHFTAAFRRTFGRPPSTWSSPQEN